MNIDIPRTICISNFLAKSFELFPFKISQMRVIQTVSLLFGYTTTVEKLQFNQQIALTFLFSTFYFFFSVSQLDELVGREPSRELLVHRPLRRPRHVPALRHHPAGNRQLEESCQVRFPD